MLADNEYEAAYRRLRERLLVSRKRAGLTQAQVARILGKPQSVVSKIETGERRVDFLEMQVLASIYRTPLSYFAEENLWTQRGPADG